VLRYKLVRVEDSQAVVSNSITAKAKENGEDIITRMIETAANEVLTKVVSSAPRSSIVESSPSNAPVANTSKIPKATQSQTTILFVPFAKVMNEAFAKDYVGKSIKTKVRFVAPGQEGERVFNFIPLRL